MTRNRLWLCVPPLIFCLLDQGLTLWSQPGRFWQGEYLVALEANPLSYRLLSLHPLLFGVGVVLWIILFAVLIVWLPLRLALIVSITVTFGHLWGAVGWIMNCSVMGCPFTAAYAYWICLTLILAAGILTVVAWERVHFVK